MKTKNTTLTEIVLPNDTNPLGILLGGKLLHWMDIAAVICAQNHAKKVVVTVSVFNVVFAKPILLGEVVYINAHIVRVFNSSLEIKVSVYSKKLEDENESFSAEAFFTFSLVDKNEILPSLENIEDEFQFKLSKTRKEISKLLFKNNRDKMESLIDFTEKLLK